MLQRMMFSLIVLGLGAGLFASPTWAVTVTFEDLSLGTEDYWNGDYDPEDESGNTDFLFFSGPAYFYNYQDAFSWEGFAYSNRTDTDSTSTNGQYTAYSSNGTGGGANGSNNYGIAYQGSDWGSHIALKPSVSWDEASIVSGAYVTNNAYTYHSMLNGDSFAKKFGGTTGDDADWFKLTIYGLDETWGKMESNSVEFYLADYRSDDNSQDYIVTDWTNVDLTSLGEVYGLEFELSSSDSGDFGMNTPAYVAIDDISLVPEPSTMVLLLMAAAAGAIAWRRRVSTTAN